MKNSILQKQRLIDKLVEFRMRIQINNKMQLFDVNRLSQAFIAKLLNIIYHRDGASFRDMDKIKANYPAVDIADFESKIGYQITSQNDTSKIYETISKFQAAYLLSGELTCLKFIILNDLNWSEIQYKNIEKRFNDNNIDYGKDSIRTIEQLESDIISLDEEAQELITNLLEKEFGNFSRIEANQDKFDKLRKELFARMQHHHISPWSYAQSEDEMEFKKLLRDKDSISAKLFEEEKFRELIDLWKPLHQLDLFDINHPYWSDKPFFRRLIQAAKMDLCISLCYLSINNPDEFTAKDWLDLIGEILRASTYSTTGGSRTNLSREAAIFENNESILFFENMVYFFKELKRSWGDEAIKTMLKIDPYLVSNLIEKCEYKKALIESIND